MQKISKTIKECQICSKPFKPAHYRPDQIFCSKACADKSHSNKKRLIRKEFVDLKGGCCEVCGYKKSISALCFHHIDPKKKEMSFDIGQITFKDKNKLIKELKKCQLLCSNCHAEAHDKLSK